MVVSLALLEYGLGEERQRHPVRLGHAAADERKAAAASKPAARGSVKPSTANAFIGKGLSGTLSKQSPAFPYPWQKREVEVVGEAIMYKAGGGAQKAISVREIKAIRMTDAVKFEFEVVTSNHSYKFRGSDKTNAFQWVNGLQQLHNRVLHAK